MDNLERLAKFASTDETRIQLHYVTPHSDFNAACATDGARLILDRSAYDEALGPFKASTYLKTGDFVNPDWGGFNFPLDDIKSIWPVLEKYSSEIEFKVPAWLSKIKLGKKHLPARITDKGWIVFTDQSIDNSLIVDLALFIPLAGETLKIRFKEVRDNDCNFKDYDKHAPIHFTLNEYVEGLVMPMRG